VIDYGLLVSIIIAFGLPSLAAYRWPLTDSGEPVGFIDVAIGPAVAGLVVGRLVTLALDDSNSIGSISDMLIIRSGVEFWPGVAAAVALLMWNARRAGEPLLTRVAWLVPLAMFGYAGYEAACLFRDGCFGPESAIGLRPPGLSTTMLPIGLFMAGAVATGAVGVHRLVAGGRRPVVIVLAAALIVASVRAVGAIWLPHVGDGLTRQHQTSIVVAAGAMVALVIAVVVSPRHSVREAPEPRLSETNGASGVGDFAD
jgi:hypothetical protein